MEEDAACPGVTSAKKAPPIFGNRIAEASTVLSSKQILTQCGIHAVSRLSSILVVRIGRVLLRIATACLG